jgi:autotransporter-associated beta strand protein
LTLRSSNGTGILALKGGSGVVYTLGANVATGLTLDGGWIGLWQGNAETVGGFISLSANGGNLDPQLNSPLNITAQISGAGFLRIDSTSSSGPAAGRVVLSGINTYAGGTIIDAADTLQLSGAGTLGSTNSPLMFLNTNGNRGYGTLDLNGTSQAIGNLSGAGGTTSTLTIGNGNTTGGSFAGVIANGNGTVALTKVGTGTLTLSATNTYSGGTTVLGGTLQMSTVSGSFSGGGTVVLMSASTQSVQRVNAGASPFWGKWIVASGWLAGATNGALGTNDITVDPQYHLDASAGGSPLGGVAAFEPDYDLNSAGALTLTNGGQMILHQNCAFSSVTVEGTILSAGTHSCLELTTNFPNNFPAGGAGYVTVQPYGALPAPPAEKPQFLTQPKSQTNYAGATVLFSVSAYGNPAPTYQWRAGAAGEGVYTNLVSGGQIASVTNSTLTVSNIALSNSAEYVAVASNASGAVTSAPAILAVIPPATVSSYPLPSIYTESSTYALKVNGAAIPVVSYVGDYDYAEFSMSSGAATIEVTASTQSSIGSYSISPKKLGVAGATSGNKLTFGLDASRYLILQINGLKRLIIAADPAETSVPPSSGAGVFNVLASPYNADNSGATKTTSALQNAINDASAYGSSAKGQGIVYMPPGVYLAGNIQLKANVALYMQGGAVIRATGTPSDYTNDWFKTSQNHYVTWLLSTTNGATNVTIYGRGTVDANGYYLANTMNYGINFLVPIGCTNFGVDGITFRDSGSWGIIPARSANVRFSNMKIFNHRDTGEDDGIDICESQNVVVSNAVAVALDDSYSTKTWANGTDIAVNWPGEAQPLSNAVFDNCLAWSYCYAFKVGAGTMQPQSGITVTNGVAYDCAGALGIDHKYGAMPVSAVTFDTVDVESVRQVNAGHGAWAVFLVENGLGDGGGPVSNVLVKNITVRDAGTTGGFIQGINSYGSLDGITFDHVYMPGSNAPASNLYQMAMTNTSFYSGLTILPVQTPEPLLIVSQPASQSLYVQQNARFTVSAWGNLPLSYQWQVKSNGAYVNLVDGGRISGSTEATLVVADVAFSDATDYLALVSNAYASTSSAPARLTVLSPLGPPANVTMSTVEPNVSPADDWNTGGYWNNGLSASNTVAAYPGSTFEIQRGGAMRTPYNVSAASFPGIALAVDGNGVWNSTANIGQILLKNANGGTVNFPSLIMKGGQIANYTDSAGSSVITGLMHVLSNAPVTANNTGSGGTVQIAAQLTGDGSIEYHAYNSSTFRSAWICDLNISGDQNTYSGTWNVVVGTLMGSGVNALGTNTITVGSNAALQTTYDIYNPCGALVLNGRINLTQNDVFGAVLIDGAPLQPGWYSFAQLHAAYPDHFPAGWTLQPGSSAVSGSGSLTVLSAGLAGPATLTGMRSGTNLLLLWPGTGLLLEATTLAGPWSTNTGAISPFSVAPSAAQMFYRVKIQ